MATRLVGVRVDFEDYVAAKWTRLVRSAVFMGLDQHAAEDIVQTALTKCFSAWPRVEKASDPDAYVHRVLINTMRDSRRRRWWIERPSANLPDRSVVSDSAEGVAVRDALRQALLRLPAQNRQILVLRFYMDLSEAQTAAALDIPLGTVKSRAARGLKALENDQSLHELSRGDGR